MDYYNTLGVNRNATQDEIKKAYRSMAMKHHPDRGGDERRFKEIEEAYRTLSDPQKKQMFDMGVDPNQQQGRGFYNQGPFEFHFGTGNMEDIFANFGFGSRPLRKNKSLSINVQLTLEDVLYGKDISAEVSTLRGQKKLINISIPPGIEHGQQIRYEGMGDNSIPDIRAGDLIVNVMVVPHEKFHRDRDNLIYEHHISVWDAILGTSIEVPTLDKRKLNVTIAPGTQHDTVLSCRQEGLPNVKNRRKGNLLIKIKIDIPKNLDQTQIDYIKKIKHGI
jgi:DnaJ-class molecular chaperone